MQSQPTESAGLQAAKWIVGAVIVLAMLCGLLGTCVFIVLIAAGVLTGG